MAKLETKTLNLYAVNNKQTPIPLEINVSHTGPILSKPEQYQVSVMKVVLDLNTIPLLVQDVPNDANRAICVIYKPKKGELCYVEEYITWQPHSYNQSLNEYYYDQYSYEGILQSINEAYKRAFSRLDNRAFAINPPIFTLNPELNKIQVTLNSVIIPAINNGNTKTFPDVPAEGDALYIGVCKGMNSWFDGFNNFYVSGITDAKFPLNLNNILRFLTIPMCEKTQTIIQSKSSLDAINGTTNITITSTLPITPELMPHLNINSDFSTQNLFTGQNSILMECSIGSRNFNTNLLEYVPSNYHIPLKQIATFVDFQIRAFFVNKGNTADQPIFKEIYLEESAFFNIKLKFEPIERV